MLQKTRGIVLHHIRYSETSLIIRIYTESFGLQSYLVKGARSKRSSMRSSMFQPMTLLNMVVYHRNSRELQGIREAAIEKPFHSIASDLRKSTIAIFLSEVLLKTIREREANPDLFDFLASSLHFFDMQEDGIECFHLYFLLMLSRFLGLYPQEGDDGQDYFDLREGKFVAGKPLHPDYAGMKTSRGLLMLSRATAADLGSLHMDRDLRNAILDTLLTYYQVHLSGLGTLKSVEVLRDVFN